jgi:hypothetical protein
MTLSADIAFEEYTIVDDNAPLEFPHMWEFNDEIVVFENGVLLDLGADYSLTGAGAPGGGQINPVAALVGARWTAYRFTRLAQITVPSDASVGFALDRLTRMAQDNSRDLARSLKIDDETVLDIPSPILPGKALIGNATGTGFEYGGTTDADFAAMEAQIAGVAADLAAEAVTRGDADGTLGNQITAEAIARDAAIAAEAAARIAQDDVLMGLITADGGLADPSELAAYLGLDATNAGLAAAQSDITTLQAEMDAEQAITGPITAYAKTLLDDIDASTALSTLGVSAYAKTLLDDADASTALGTLGFSAYGKTLIDDADASTALSTLGFSAFGKTIIDDASGAAVQTTLGITSAAQTILDDTSIANIQTTLGISAFIKTLIDDADAGTAQTTLGISTFIKALLDDTSGNQAFGSLGGATGSNSNGAYVTLFNFFKCQWASTVGTVAGGGGGIGLNFPISFTNSTAYTVIAWNGDSTSGNVILTLYQAGKAATGFTVVAKTANTGAVLADATNIRVDWIAIGT